MRFVLLLLLHHSGNLSIPHYHMFLLLQIMQLFLLNFLQHKGDLRISRDSRVFFWWDRDRGRTDKKLTNTLVIWTFLSFELADIFLNYGSRLFFKKAKKTPIYILIANDDANTTP